MAERPHPLSVTLVAAAALFGASCSAGSDAAPVVEQADISCAERKITLDGLGQDDMVSVTVVDSERSEDDDIARQILETLELSRVDGDVDGRITPMGSQELADSGFVLDAGPGCRTEVTFDPDVGAESASLRFVQLQIDSPGCDVIRFRTVLLDSVWQLDSVTTAPPAALEEVCGVND